MNHSDCRKIVPKSGGDTYIYICTYIHNIHTRTHTYIYIYTYIYVYYRYIIPVLYVYYDYNVHLFLNIYFYMYIYIVQISCLHNLYIRMLHSYFFIVILHCILFHHIATLCCITLYCIVYCCISCIVLYCMKFYFISYCLIFYHYVISYMCHTARGKLPQRLRLWSTVAAGALALKQAAPGPVLWRWAY